MISEKTVDTEFINYGLAQTLFSFVDSRSALFARRPLKF